MKKSPDRRPYCEPSKDWCKPAQKMVIYATLLFPTFYQMKQCEVRNFRIVIRRICWCHSRCIIASKQVGYFLFNLSREGLRATTSITDNIKTIRFHISKITFLKTQLFSFVNGPSLASFCLFSSFSKLHFTEKVQMEELL